MKKIMLFWGKYYPIVLAFVSFLYSVSLWFIGYKLEGIFVGIWVPSILYIFGLLYVINNGHKEQEQDLLNDPEIPKKFKDSLTD